MVEQLQMPQPSWASRLSNPSQSAADWDERYRSSQSVWSLAPNQFVVSELSDITPQHVVDLAGGEGRNALWFAARGITSENVEFSAVALEKFLVRADQAGHKNKVIANHADARSAKFSKAPDLLLICYLQLPWNDLSAALDNALSQMHQGEIFGIWHARRNLTEGFGGPQRAELLPTPEQLTQWASERGLGHKVWEVERKVDTPEGEFVALDVILRAKLGS